MTYSKLEDNMVLSQLNKCYSGLLKKGLTTESEAESVRQNLRYRLRPNV